MRFVLLLLILCMTAVSACDNKVNSSTPAVFNKQATLLMTLPAGYEVEDVTFSDDGFQVAAVLRKDGKMCLCINSALSPMYEEVRAPVFHADSKQYAFIARKDGKECVVFNGKEGALYDSVRNPLITADARLVYVAKHGEKWCIVAGNKVSQPFDSPNPSLYASRDGKRLAFLEQNISTKKFNLCTCSSKLKEYARGREYDEIANNGNSLSGTHLAYRVGNNGKQAFVLFDFRQPGCIEKESGWYDKVGSFALSNNGEHVAFFAERMGKHYLVSAGNEWPCTDYKMLFDVMVSDKGNALYSGAREYSLILSLDGKVVTDRRESIEHLTFSNDSNHFLFVTGPCPLIPTAKPVEFSYLVVDGHESKKYDKIINPRFAPDNTHVVFRARAAGKRFLVVANKEGKILQEKQAHEAVWDYKFSPDGKLVGYGVRNGQELWWEVATLVQEKH